jgi:hypothetical protein
MAVVVQSVRADDAMPLATDDKSPLMITLLNGLGARFSYPSSWSASVNYMEEMVELVSDDGAGDEVCVVRGEDISALGDAAGVRDDFIAIVSNNEFSDLLPTGFELLSGQQIAVADRPAAQIVAAKKAETEEQAEYRFSVFSFVYVEGALVVLSCDTRAPTQPQALAKFKTQFPVFSDIANSLVIAELPRARITTRFSPFDFP